MRVLDFGLAKAGCRWSLPADAKNDARRWVHSPGQAILGTTAYMSPEQARGLTVDKRTDIWAFGCVLFEMLSGRRAFEGNTDADTVVRILDQEPDWASIPTDTPATTQMLLDRCLRKEARRRLRDIGDAVLDIEESLAANAGSAHTLGVSSRGSAWQLRWIETQHIAGASDFTSSVVCRRRDAARGCHGQSVSRSSFHWRPRCRYGHNRQSRSRRAFALTGICRRICCSCNKMILASSHRTANASSSGPP